MSWEASMFALFEDLEQQAAGLQLVERDLEVAELTVAEYSRVSLGERLHASLDHDLRVRLVGGRQLSGRLARVGEDWMLLVDGATEWIVRTAGAVSIVGLSLRADNEKTWSVVDRLSLRALLRGLSTDSAACVIHFVDDQQLQGRIGRVGEDFVEVQVGEGAGRSVQVVQVTTVTALQEQS
jgi:hypothetical protein